MSDRRLRSRPSDRACTTRQSPASSARPRRQADRRQGAAPRREPAAGRRHAPNRARMCANNRAGASCRHAARSRAARASRPRAWSRAVRSRAGSIHPVTSVSAGPAARRIVFESAIARRIVRGRDHDSVGEPGRPFSIEAQNRVRHRRSRRVLVAFGQHHMHAVRREHLQRRRARPARRGACVSKAEKEWAVDSALFAIADKSLR